jgi:ABC-type glycerol-3-phosphate transport system substrate-binding protein
VTVTWWSGWGSGGITGQTFDQVAAAANQAALGYHVQHEPQSSVAKKLATVIAARTPPDVEVGNLSYPEFWTTGQAMALDSYLAKSQTLKREDLLDTSWKFGTYLGHTYGVPAAEAFVRWGTVANTDLLAKRGLDPTQVPTNWSDLLEWHKELTVLDPATKAITQLGLDPLDAMGGSASGGDPFFWGPSFGLGTGYYDEGAGKFNLVTPQLTDALTTIKSFYDAAGGYAAVQTFHKTNGTWTGAKAGIVLGTQAMQINGYWTPGSLTKLAPTKHYVYTWAPVSADRKGTKMQSAGGHFAVLPKGSPHVDQAFSFAEFLTGEPAEKIIFDGNGFLGARKSFLAKVDAKQYPGIDFYLQSATTAGEQWADPVDPIESFFSDNWQTQYTKVFQGQLTPQDALSQLQQLCTAQLAKQLGKS